MRTKVICPWCGEERFADECTREDELRNSCQSGAIFKDPALTTDFGQFVRIMRHLTAGDCGTQQH
jgi:hypothetical protein